MVLPVFPQMEFPGRMAAGFLVVEKLASLWCKSAHRLLKSIAKRQKEAVSSSSLASSPMVVLDSILRTESCDTDQFLSVYRLPVLYLYLSCHSVSIFISNIFICFSVCLTPRLLSVFHALLCSSHILLLCSCNLHQ